MHFSFSNCKKSNVGTTHTYMYYTTCTYISFRYCLYFQRFRSLSKGAFLSSHSPLLAMKSQNITAVSPNTFRTCPQLFYQVSVCLHDSCWCWFPASSLHQIIAKNLPKQASQTLKTLEKRKVSPSSIIVDDSEETIIIDDNDEQLKC